MADAFIKIYRKMLDWEWYDDPNTCRVFIHCLLRANWKPCRWHGIEIEPGQFITSLQNLADETCLTIRQVRGALDHLKMTGEVTIIRHSKCSVITVNNWNDYQGNDKQNVTRKANKGQSNDNQMTTDKEYKEYKEREEGKEVKNIYGEYRHVRLSQKEHERLVNDFGEAETHEAIKFLDEYKEMKGYKCKNDNLAMRKWVFTAVKEDKAKQGKPQTSVFDAWANA
jgi:hypothetical protein